MAVNKKEAFIKKYQAAAVAAAAGTGILPGTILTVAAVESRYGESLLASKYNNFFGRKPESSYTGKRVNLNTREVIKGKEVIMNEPFKVYNTPEDGFRDYVRLLSRTPRYKKVLAQNTVQGQFAELQKGGYATDPQYASILSSVYNSLSKFMTPLNGALGLVVLAATFFF